MMNSNLIGAVLCATLVAVTVNAGHWDYTLDGDHGKHGPLHWKEDFPACGKNKQSPIDINEAQANDTLTLAFNNYNQTVGLKASNNGHSVVFKVTSAPHGNPHITGKGLPTTASSVFKLLQLHFHWGMGDEDGSEHFLNGWQYPMEVHFVHYNTKYSSVSEAVDKKDGLAVAGFLFEISPQNNTDYAPIVNALSSIVNPGPTTNVSLNLGNLLGETRDFFRYAGSLTTPPCYESVTWTVFKKPIKISSSQMAVFRALTVDGKHPIEFNFRPLQPLNGRTVYAKSGNV